MPSAAINTSDVLSGMAAGILGVVLRVKQAVTLVVSWV